MLESAIAAVSLIVWIVLLFGRGWFWIPQVHARHFRLRHLPRVAIVIPARNEAECIGAVVQSFLMQQYAGPAHIFLVDDHSSDDTLKLVRAVSRRLGLNA